MSLRVFISWSKSRSYVVAKTLQGWLRELLPGVVVLMSDDVESGDPELPSLNEMLRKADFALLCMTADNWKEPWIFYEAGMVYGKSDEKAKVCPYIIDLHLKRRKLPEPLKQFRAEKATKEDTLHLVKRLNKALGYPLNGDELKADFEAKWPELEKVIMEIQPETDQPHPRLCVQDYKVVSDHIDGHQDRLESRLRDCIDTAVASAQSDTFDVEKIVELAWEEIELSKERFRDSNSVLVGNVADFFSANYKKDNLRATVLSMRSELVPGRDPHTVTAKLVARVQRELLEVFKRFHRILLGRLKECLGEGEVA